LFPSPVSPQVSAKALEGWVGLVIVQGIPLNLLLSCFYGTIRILSP